MRPPLPPTPEVNLEEVPREDLLAALEHAGIPEHLLALVEDREAPSSFDSTSRELRGMTRALLREAARVISGTRTIIADMEVLGRKIDRVLAERDHALDRANRAEGFHARGNRCTLRAGHDGPHLRDPSQPAGGECGVAIPSST